MHRRTGRYPDPDCGDLALHPRGVSREPDTGAAANATGVQAVGTEHRNHGLFQPPHVINNECAFG
jgi:hypothetical protein